MARLSFDSRKHAALDAARAGDVATAATMAAYRRTCALSWARRSATLPF